MERLELHGSHKRMVIVAQDSFYRDLTSADEIAKARRCYFNFDHPNAFEHQLMLNTLRQLCQGKSVVIPKYDLKEQRRLIDASHRLEAADVIFGGGHCSPIKVERDTTELGRPLDQVLHQYLSLVKPAYEDFCLPTKKYADVIITRGAEITSICCCSHGGGGCGGIDDGLARGVGAAARSTRRRTSAVYRTGSLWNKACKFGRKMMINHKCVPTDDDLR